MDKVRYTAARCLMRIEGDGFSNLTLKQELAGIENERDAAFCTALVYGTVSRLRTLDFVLTGLCAKPLDRLDAEIRAILRSGAYQLLYMSRVPAHAAVSESVALAYAFKKRSAAGLVNAILRAVPRFDFGRLDRIADPVRRLAVRWSSSDDVARLLIDQYGELRAGQMLEATLEPQHRYIRVNSLAGDPDETLRLLCDGGFRLEPTFVPGVWRQTDGLPLQKSPLFADGRVAIVGLWSAAAAHALSPQPGDKTIDCCAAPGGKTAILAELMRNTGELFACDVQPARLRLLRETCRRLKAGARVMLADAAVFCPTLGGADGVLCDVPCSGLGMLAAKPELRYKKAGELAGLPALQRAILENAARYVKTGGRLVYSTCTVNTAENEGVTAAFRAAHPELRPVMPAVFAGHPLQTDGSVINLPLTAGEHGFYVATFQKMW